MARDFTARKGSVINLLYSAGRTSALKDNQIWIFLFDYFDGGVLSIDFVKGANVSEILNQLILENIYKSDYKNVTEKLLEENLTYETVIQALKEIYENGIFSN